MTELTVEELAGFASAFEPLCAPFALTLSENLNQAVLFDTPVITQEAIDGLMQDPIPVLQTTFAYSGFSGEESALVFQASDALVFADLISGGSGQAPPTSLDDAQMNELANALHGIVQGLGVAIGNMLNRSVQPESCSTTLEALTLPPSFAVSGKAVQIEIPFHIEAVLDSSLRLFITPGLARAWMPKSEEAAPAGLAGGAFGEAGDYPVQPDPSLLAGVFRPFDAPGGAPDSLPRGLDRILDIPLEVTVELGRTQMLIRDVLELAAGSIVELDSIAGAPVDLLVNGRLVAKGEVIVIDDNFGLRITEIISPADRLHGLGQRAA